MVVIDENTVIQYGNEALTHMNWLFARKVQCYTDARTHQRVCKHESFFHRIGRWILTAFLIFFALIALMVICCCMRRSRKKRAANAVPMQQVYAQTPNPYANYGPPPPVPQPPAPMYPARK